MVEASDPEREEVEVIHEFLVSALRGGVCAHGGKAGRDLGLGQAYDE
jgi:hypothetical protein